MNKEPVMPMMSDNKQPLITEVLLELVQETDGRLLLRESKNKDEVLVAINFSDKVREVLGEDAHHIGERMIQAAMSAVMYSQINKWHAHVFDEEPKFFS